MFVRQIGHFGALSLYRDNAHSSQNFLWPHGTMTVSLSLVKHIQLYIDSKESMYSSATIS